MNRYHMTVKFPINPENADKIHFAQIMENGMFKQCVDVHDSNISKFERWANQSNSVIRYTTERI